MTTEETIALDAVKQIGITASLDTLRAADGLVNSLLGLFADNELGIRGNHNDNGADWLSCDSCGMQVDVRGYVSTYNHITVFEHHSHCSLFKLYELVMSLTHYNKP